MSEITRRLVMEMNIHTRGTHWDLRVRVVMVGQRMEFEYRCGQDALGVDVWRSLEALPDKSRAEVFEAIAREFISSRERE